MKIIFYKTGVAPMVQDAKAVAINTNDGPAVSRWRESNRAVSLTIENTRIYKKSGEKITNEDKNATLKQRNSIV